MSDSTIFINRRRGVRREDPDPCAELPLDLYNRKRRKTKERRDQGKSLADDYYAAAKPEDNTVSSES